LNPILEEKRAMDLMLLEVNQHWKERESRDSITMKGLLCVKVNQWEMNLINPMDIMSLVGNNGDLCCFKRNGGE
jgi:hypothetical protein